MTDTTTNHGALAMEIAKAMSKQLGMCCTDNPCPCCRERYKFVTGIINAQLAEFEARQWPLFSEREPEFPPGEDSVGCICETTDGQIIAMEWTRFRGAATERGRRPRWVWNQSNSPWGVNRWRYNPTPPAQVKE